MQWTLAAALAAGDAQKTSRKTDQKFLVRVSSSVVDVAKVGSLLANWQLCRGAGVSLGLSNSNDEEALPRCRDCAAKTRRSVWAEALATGEDTR